MSIDRKLHSSPARLPASKPGPQRSTKAYAGPNSFPAHSEATEPLLAAPRRSFDFAHIPIMAPGTVDGAVAGVRQYRQSQGQCPPAASGTGGPLTGPATAFGNTFNILWSNASVHGGFRPPSTSQQGVIDQFGPSFSMGGRVEAPATAAGFRLGIVQEVAQSLRRAHYNNLSTGAPLLICEYTAGRGLDLTPRSLPPWYDSRNTAMMSPIARVGIADDPHGQFMLVVNNQGDMAGTPAGKLARLSGCDQFYTWLVIEAPNGPKQAIAWVSWVANWNVAYNTVFTSLSAGPPTTTATSSGLTGWIASAPQIGAGPPIPANVAPPFIRRCIP